MYPTSLRWARPRWAFLAFALPAADEAWIAAFARGFFACAGAHDIDLAGGDTTRGPLTLSVTLLGEVPQGAAVTRAGGRAGDDLWVSGQPGRAALGLAALKGEISLTVTGRADCIRALQRPQPRVELGLALRGLASAMLDVSDGLLGDLGHILEASRTGACIDVAALPLAALQAAGADPAQAQRCLLGGGDDYELLFAAAAERRAEVEALGTRIGLALHRIGALTAEAGALWLREADGTLVPSGRPGYDHFG